MNAMILVTFAVSLVLMAAGPVSSQFFGPVPFGAPGFGPAGFGPPPVALAPVLPHRRFYSGNYGYVTGGPGPFGTGGFANVHAAQDLNSYNFHVTENGPLYSKYHHQAAAFLPVPVPVAPAVGVLPPIF